MKSNVGLSDGSILIPVLSLIFINDIALTCEGTNDIRLYAGDINIARKDNDNEFLIRSTNLSPLQFQEYCTNNDLTSM